MSESQSLALEFSVIAREGLASLVDETALHSLVQMILEAEGASGAWEVAVALVGDDELQALHLQFMGIDEPTDIMTFPYGDEIPGGDLVISADHARVRAAEWGNSPAQEVQFLVAHGVLHLLGWRDDSAEQRAAMLGKQNDLVQAWRARAGS